ncbi:MAG: ATP-binding protein [Bacteroidales bacterium]|jgi:anti-sigma regulatory factor (Ser/Thr protein kinase)|nr:ATP-binding protein [Bacteroidales bacterium]MCK9499033.1 ATP-binding protein [Bacteroidales bacterium]MDY0313956.1 ATP-binding protein [Bacteroidales bacterium]
MELSFKIEGGNFSGAGSASSEVKRTLKQLDVDASQIKRIVIALYEAEINVVAHAFGGKIEVKISADKVFARIQDQGPGIADISKAMQEGYSTASSKVREMGFGAGMGLPNIKSNVDVFDIQSVVNEGTVLEMTFYLS